MTCQFLIQNLLYILFIPLFSAVFIMLFLRRGAYLSGLVASGAVLAIVLLVFRIITQWEGEALHAYVDWFSLPPIRFCFGILFDNIGLLMLTIVALIGFLVHIFSIGYMEADLSKGRYFAGLSIFMFSMLGIVLADNLALVFVFWELVGFSSYVLISHYYQNPSAKMASKKAFIVNRVGDFGFLLGIIWTYWQFNTLDFSALYVSALAHPNLVITPISCLLICAFLGKSAQFPLQVWLPDAMAGPTPVSALIHAATMVAAGIFFLTRVFFLLTPSALHFILWICTPMTVLAGLCALCQNDIKKILAYSTLSQLAYMGVALGLNAPGLSLFHLSTHAFFKAGLFLCAGSVIHGLHHEQNIFKMGGLLKKMPITGTVFIITTLALCGVYGTSGFFSKDAILELAYINNKSLFFILILGAFLTPLYMGRLLLSVLFGPPMSHKAQHAHEANTWMTPPLVILGIFSIIAGYTHFWPSSLSLCFINELSYIHDIIHEQEAHAFVVALSSTVVILGLLLAYILYRPNAPKNSLSLKWQTMHSLLQNQFGIDRLYDSYVIKIQQPFASIMHLIDLAVFGGLFMRGLAGLFGFCGMLFKKSHSGSIHLYAAYCVGGLLIMLWLIIKILL